jgi:hypothetical protein
VNKTISFSRDYHFKYASFSIDIGGMGFETVSHIYNSDDKKTLCNLKNPPDAIEHPTFYSKCSECNNVFERFIKDNNLELKMSFGGVEEYSTKEG